jgi:putative endonuclease
MAQTRKIRQPGAQVITWPEGVRRASGRTGSRPAAVVPAPTALQGQHKRHTRGALSELLAAALLMLKGYRILDRRYRSRRGEIDIIAVRGQRLSFVEVKYRRTLAEAETSITGTQAARIANSAEQWVWRNAAYRDHEIGLDAVLVAPGRLPRHLPNALQPG